MVHFEPLAAIDEVSSANAKVHEESNEPLGVTEPKTSTPGLQTVTGPHTIVASPPPPAARRDSLVSGLEAASPAEQKMPPLPGASPGSGFAATPTQHMWAGMIPWDKETEQGKMVVHHAGGENHERNKWRRRWIWILAIIVLLTLASTAPSPTPSDTAPLCPGANNTVIDDGGTQYRRICGISYDGNDIQPQKADTMGQCLSLCSAHTGQVACAGVVWYDAGPQGTDLNWCWLKRSMDKAVLSYRDAAQTAIRL
ncbi:hypothetical protein PG996_006487 [Apiospora saccharicola]|uniref:Apple domain-containing protein n=1 Tax=Apiospora saccharicola TaxID=335842 RepID=A0ABR1VPH0_9PEZI